MGTACLHSWYSDTGQMQDGNFDDQNYEGKNRIMLGLRRTGPQLYKIHNAGKIVSCFV
jgi:hypothetical protein